MFSGMPFRSILRFAQSLDRTERFAVRTLPRFLNEDDPVALNLTTDVSNGLGFSLRSAIALVDDQKPVSGKFLTLLLPLVKTRPSGAGSILIVLVFVPPFAGRIKKRVHVIIQGIVD